MLTYTCQTCETKYDAKLSENKVSYMFGNRLIILKDDSEDCDSCRQEIKQAQEEKRQQIRAKKLLI